MSDTLNAVKMLNDWMFVRPIEEVVEGKVIVPDTAKPITQKGILVKLGEKVDDKNLKVEDQILFQRRAAYSATIEVDGEKLLVMKPSAILAIIFGENVTDVNPLKENVFLEWQMATDFYPGTTIKRPESSKSMHFTGIVRAIGPDVKELVIGDRVFFDQFCGIEKFQEDGKRYGFVQIKDIFCSGVPMREEVAVNANHI